MFPLFVSVVQTPLLQLVELEPESSSVLPSSVLPSLEVEVEVEVVVVHTSLPFSSATQVFVSVTQTSLLQLVDVEVEVVPGSLAKALALNVPIAAASNIDSTLSTARYLDIRWERSTFMCEIS